MIKTVGQQCSHEPFLLALAVLLSHMPAQLKKLGADTQTLRLEYI